MLKYKMIKIQLFPCSDTTHRVDTLWRKSIVLRCSNLHIDKQRYAWSAKKRECESFYAVEKWIYGQLIQRYFDTHDGIDDCHSFAAYEISTRSKKPRKRKKLLHNYKL